jgi:hypothetical protein
MGVQLSRAFDPGLRSCVRQGGVLTGPVCFPGTRPDMGVRRSPAARSSPNGYEVVDKPEMT